MDQDNDDATSGERQISYHFAVALNLAQLHSDQVIQHTSIDSALKRRAAIPNDPRTGRQGIIGPGDPEISVEM